MTAIRYFFSLLTGKSSWVATSAAWFEIIGLQWTKVNRSATLQCNVDRFQLVL
jgi:hypothetical protein